MTVSCLDGSRWWRSIHGVVLCLNCQPPASPCLVEEQGEATNAPLVLASCSRVLAVADCPDRPRDPRAAFVLGRAVWILRGDHTPEKVEPRGERKKIRIPADATHWCCAGDSRWTRIEKD
jgi:hypothetical protein